LPAAAAAGTPLPPGGIEVSREESGTSESTTAGRAAQMIPALEGLGPAAEVWDMGDSLLKVTPLIVTSVGELISSTGTPPPAT